MDDFISDMKQIRQELEKHKRTIDNEFKKSRDILKSIKYILFIILIYYL